MGRLQMGRSEKVLVDALRNVVDDRMHNYADFKSCDILQLLVQQTQDAKTDGKKSLQLTSTEILGNSYVFLLAGYETTSTALGFTAWLLTKWPETQRKLQQEIDEMLPEVRAFLPFLESRLKMW